MQFCDEPCAFFSQVATKEMKKKKQKHRIKEMEKRSSEKEMDMMDAYTDKPVQEQVSSCFLAYDVIIILSINFLWAGAMGVHVEFWSNYDVVVHMRIYNCALSFCVI